MKSRVLRSKLLWFGIGVVVAVIWAANFFPYWRPAYWSSRADLAAAKASIRAQGEPVTFADLQASDETGYRIGTEAASVLETLVDTTWEFREALRSEPGASSFDKELLLDALQENRDSMDALAEIEHVGECRFSYDFSVASPMDTLLPSVQAVIDASYLWRADALLSLLSSDYDQAIMAVTELCDTTELLRREPFVVSQLARARIGGHAVDSLEQVLAVVDLHADQFTAIDERLAVMESSYRLGDTLRAERASLLTTLENIRHPDVREDLGMMAGLGSGGGLFSFAPQDSAIDKWGSLSYAPHLMGQQTWMLRQMTAAANVVDEPGEGATEQWNKIDQQISNMLESNEGSPLASLLPAVTYLRDPAFAYRQRLMAARLALRVIRYRSTNQTLPANLDAVRDEQMATGVRGLWNGDEANFNTRPDGFEISYSAAGINDDLKTGVSISFPLVEEGEGSNAGGVGKEITKP